MKQEIRTLAQNGHYKYQIYLKFNPNLEKSPFIDILHPLSNIIIKFRLGSHKLPIETGRWSRISRDQRFCTVCGVGDESHFFKRLCSDRKRYFIPSESRTNMASPKYV